MSGHDALYHRLSSHPAMVTQLLEGFVEEPFVATLDLGRMRRISGKFHAKSGLRRDSDIVWRIPLKAGGDAYLLLMLEFQSTPDRWMALRTLVYAGLLWQQIVKEKRLPPDGKLPPVFPLVLYNGDPRWKMPVGLSDLIGLPPDASLWHWQPAMRYHLVDEGAFANADLASRDTLAALLFQLENTRDPSEVEAIVDAVIDWFRRHDGFAALKPVFGALAYRIVALPEEITAGTRVMEDLLEVKTMLANRREEWKALWLNEGLQAGRQQGEVAILTRMLERRFGTLSGEAKDRIATADTTQIEDWSLRLLDAASLDDVLR